MKSRWLFLVLLVGLLLVNAAPVAAAPLADGGDLLGGLQGFLTGVARAAAVIGLLLFGLSLIMPQDILQTIGLNVPPNFLTRMIMGIFIITAASLIVSSIFDLF